MSKLLPAHLFQLLGSSPTAAGLAVLIVLALGGLIIFTAGSRATLAAHLVLIGAAVVLTAQFILHLLESEVRTMLAKPEKAPADCAPVTQVLLPQLAAQLADHCGTLLVLRSEKEMLLSRYQVLSENLAAAIIIRDADGRLTYCSPYTEVLTGYAVDEIYASQQDFFLSILHPDDREKYQRALRVSAYGEAFQFRYRFFHKTGLEMWAETRTVPILDGSGAVVSSLSITLDVTGTVRYQQQVEEKNRDLEDFSYMVSHDLKAPIFTIKGMIQIITEDFLSQLPAGLNEVLEHIRGAAQRLEVLVTGVLEYSRVSRASSPQEAVPLAAVLHDVAQDLSPQLSAAGAALQVAADLPAVLGDQRMVYQIFSNLIGNAIKYRSPARPLAITVSSQPCKNTRYLQVLVKDNGLGIPSDKLGQIFRPFQRAHGKEIEGSGIGLACVKKLLEKLAGEIAVESSVDSGSTFLVTLRTAPATSQSETS